MKYEVLEQVTPPDYIPYFRIDFCNNDTHKVLNVDCRSWGRIKEKIINWVKDNWDNIKEQQ